ncbi:RNA polymerase sigma factor [Pendulispora albinea]|uniref:Sigma-70 family RNA polymerase sigma factor n=1 Tax=Pendulispora albinea TaxID=2741071 RepID=A0ABZ2LZD5_9BACT
MAGIDGPAKFPSTRWTLILSARESPAARRSAFDELLRDYWRPLYAFARRKGCDRERAEDAVQGFMVHLLERDFLSRLDPSRGRMRSYLRAAMEHYLVNLHEKERAQKRGGGALSVSLSSLSLDFELAERSLLETPFEPESAFDREWALTLMERAMKKLEAEFQSGQRRAPFEAVADFFRGGETPSYKDVAARHGMTIPQLKSLLHRARLRYRELVEQEAVDTVEEPGNGAFEVRELLGYLAR